MSLNKKQMQRLKQTMKRREQHAVQRAHFQPPVKLSLTERERERITNTAAGLLVRIERTIQEVWKRHPEMNDHSVEQALTSVILGRTDSGDPDVQALVQALTEVGELVQDDESPEDQSWSLALRAILKSVKTWSDFSSPHSYLEYAQSFLKKI